MSEIVIYQGQRAKIGVNLDTKHDTVWLNCNQMAELFGRDVKTIGKHIHNALGEELQDFSVVAKFATTATGGRVDKESNMRKTHNSIMVLNCFQFGNNSPMMNLLNLGKAK